MRIGFFTDTYTPQINGVVSSIRLFADALERLGHEVYIFAPTPRQPGDGPRVVRIPSVPFAFQPEMRLASIYSAQAYRLARQANLDVIHSHDPFAIGLFGLAVAKRFRLPYVHTYHTLSPEYVHSPSEEGLRQHAGGGAHDDDRRTGAGEGEFPGGNVAWPHAVPFPFSCFHIPEIRPCISALCFLPSPRARP